MSVCILTGLWTDDGRPEKTTLCGRARFNDGKRGGRLVICQACRDAIAKALDNGRYPMGEDK